MRPLRRRLAAAPAALALAALALVPGAAHAATAPATTGSTGVGPALSVPADQLARHPTSKRLVSLVCWFWCWFCGRW